MQTFTSAQYAKEFLVSKIVDEAVRTGVSLSDIEVKELYFSETYWTLPDMEEVNEAFDHDYDSAEYEEKIEGLIRSFCVEARKNNRDELDAWNEAFRTIQKEDHYLLVLIDAAVSRRATSNIPFLYLVAIGFAIGFVICVLLFLWVHM